MLTPDRIPHQQGQPLVVSLDKLADHDEQPLTAYALTVPLTVERAEQARRTIEEELEAGAVIAKLFGHDAEVTAEMKEQLAEVAAGHIGEPVPIDGDPLVVCWN